MGSEMAELDPETEGTLGDVLDENDEPIPPGPPFWETLGRSAPLPTVDPAHGGGDDDGTDG